MAEIIKSNIVDEIRKLHGEVLDQLRLSLEKGIRIGQLLVKQKGSLEHGEWLPWTEANLPFDERTARRYMTVYHNRNVLKSDNVSGLTEAYKLLAAKVEKPTTQCKTIKISDIEPNPFFGQRSIPGTWITYWQNLISAAVEWAELTDREPVWDHCILAVRWRNGKYQLIAEHDHWAALQILSKRGIIKTVTVAIAELTDEQMENALLGYWEHTEEKEEREREDEPDDFED
jgi:hypothetical protein